MENQKEVIEEMEEGYYRMNGTNRILYWDGVKWMKPVKDQRGGHGTWITALEKQPKVKYTEFIHDVKKLN